MLLIEAVRTAARRPCISYVIAHIFWELVFPTEDTCCRFEMSVVLIQTHEATSHTSEINIYSVVIRPIVL